MGWTDADIYEAYRRWQAIEFNTQLEGDNTFFGYLHASRKPGVPRKLSGDKMKGSGTKNINCFSNTRRA